MNKLEELIQQFCPDGVELKKIQDVCKKTTSGGTPLTSRSAYYNGTIPWLRTQEVNWLEITNTSVKITEEGLKNSSANWIPANCVIVAMYGATAAKVAINKIPLTTNQACCNLEIDEEKANYRYVFYWLCNEYQNLKALGEGPQSNINGQKVKNFEIPIPPLSIQQEIVNILDKFTKLQAELQAELQARTRQYKYYRNDLLNFEGKEVEWKTLGEVGKILRGTAITEKETISGEIPVVANSPNPVYFHNKSNRSGETIVIARSGAYAGLVSYYNIPFFLTDAFSVHPSNIFKTKFVYYFLKNEQEKIHLMKKGGGVPHVRANDFEFYSIPIPTLTEQERIVGILDKFDALVNDLSVGLPAEIAARRKQYEYYRGRLLDFKSVSNG